MINSTLPKFSLFLTSAIAATSFYTAPAMAQPTSKSPSTIKVEQNQDVREIKPSSNRVRGKKLIGKKCPEGTHLVWFKMPIYDKEGLFVIGHKLVPYCVDNNNVPAG